MYIYRAESFVLVISRICVCVCVCVCTLYTVLWIVPLHTELRVSPKEVNVLFTDVPSRWIHRRAAVSAETALQIKWGKRERRGCVRSWKRVPMFRVFRDQNPARKPRFRRISRFKLSSIPISIVLCKIVDEYLDDTLIQEKNRYDKY